VRLRLGGRVGAARHTDQNVAGVNAFGLFELIGVLRIEVGELFRFDLNLRGDLRVDHLLDREILLGVAAQLVECRVARGQHLLERLFRRELPLNLLHARGHFLVGRIDLARLGLLHEQLVADDLIEHAAEDLIPLLSRYRSAGAPFDRGDCPIEVGLRHRLAVHAREHVGQLRGHWLGSRRGRRLCAGCAGL